MMDMSIGTLNGLFEAEAKIDVEVNLEGETKANQAKDKQSDYPGNGGAVEELVFALWIQNFVG